MALYIFSALHKWELDATSNFYRFSGKQTNYLHKEYIKDQWGSSKAKIRFG